MSERNLILLYGGKSAEHEVSVATAKAVVKVLDLNAFSVIPVYICKAGQWMKGGVLKNNTLDLHDKREHIARDGKGDMGNVMDIMCEIGEQCVVFPLLHGTYGEDGTVQGLLELLNVPYVGCGVLSSAVGMDKIFMKTVFSQLLLPQAKYVYFSQSEWIQNRELYTRKVEIETGYPCFVKPANLGSSIGISKCITKEEFVCAVEEAFKYDLKIIVEQEIRGREVEMGVIGNERIECSVPGELKIAENFYSYEAKYKNNKTIVTIPAQVTSDQRKELERMATTAYRGLDCSGMARIDFFIDDKEGTVYINEINTIPGFTPFSMFPRLWEHTGVSYPCLIERLISLAVKRHEARQKLNHMLDN